MDRDVIGAKRKWCETNRAKTAGPILARSTIEVRTFLFAPIDLNLSLRFAYKFVLAANVSLVLSCVVAYVY